MRIYFISCEGSVLMCCHYRTVQRTELPRCWIAAAQQVCQLTILIIS